MRKFFGGLVVVLIIPFTSTVIVTQAALSLWLDPTIYQQAFQEADAYNRTTVALNELITNEYSISQPLLTSVWLEQQVNRLISDLLLLITTPQQTLQNWPAKISLHEPKQALTTVVSQVADYELADEMVSLSQLPEEIALNQLLVANLTQTDPFNPAADQFVAPVVQQFEQQLSSTQESLDRLKHLVLFGWASIAIFAFGLVLLWPGGRGKSRSLGVSLAVPSGSVLSLGVLLQTNTPLLLGLTPLVLLPKPWQSIVADIVIVLLKKFGWTLVLSSLPTLAIGLISIILSLILRHHEKNRIN